MDLEALMQKYHHELSSVDWEILGYVLNHEAQVLSMGIVELAQVVHSSKSSILRLTKKLGFTGYSEFKYFLRQAATNDVGTPQSNLFDLQQRDVDKTLKLAQQTDFAPLMQALEQAQTIYCYATGYSQRKAIDEFAKMMMLCDKRCLVLPVKTELDISMSMISTNDIVVFASLSGETDAIKENILALRAREIPIVTLTTFSPNFFAEQADYAYYYYSTPFVVAGKKHIGQSFVGLNLLFDWIFRKYVTTINQKAKE